MNETPEPNDTESECGHLPAASPAQEGGTLLRLRDVQVLNRSFRQLAEVQEALLDRLEELEEERSSPRRWLLPVIAVACVTLGVGLSAVAMIQYQNAQPDIEVTAKAPEIVVNPTPVTVTVPEDPALREALQAFSGEVTLLRQGQDGLREQNADLVSKLLASEEEKLALAKRLEELENQANETSPAQASSVPFAEEVVLPGGALEVAPGRSATAKDLSTAKTPDTWLGVVNGLFVTDGYSHVALKEATRVPDFPKLTDVVWLEWNKDGLVDGLITAKRAEFSLQQMSRNLVVTFFDGSRVRNGARIALPQKGVRLDFADVNAAAWLRHWPALGVNSASTVMDPVVKTNRQDPETLRRAIDDLMSVRRAYGYYRFASLGSIDGDTLRLVQINWFDGSGRLIKTIEADSLEVRLHSTGSVELVLKGGALLEGGLRRPFYEDRFRLHLPRQSLDSWRATGVPVTEVG